MPRGRRIDVANGVQHVMNRGLDRQNIVLNDDDRAIWWSLFERVARRHAWRVFAVTLLDNHFHIYLRTPQPNLSDGMRDLDGGYASVFNQRHHRDGPLFRGRFKSVLIDDVTHSWELSRYVHLNPFRAGLTRNPADYRWCSYRFFLDAHKAPDWLDWRTVLAEFAGTEGAARVAYKRFVEAGLGMKLKNPFPSWHDDVEESRTQDSKLADGELLVSPDAVASPILNCERANISIDGLIEAVSEVFETSSIELAQRGRHHHAGRDAAVLLARELLGLPLEDIALRFNIRTRSSVSEMVRRARLREAEDDWFRGQVLSVRNRLRNQ